MILVSNFRYEPKISKAAAVVTTFIVEAGGKLKFGLYSEIIILESKSLTTKLIEAFFNEKSFARLLMAPSIELALCCAWTNAAKQINKTNNVICFKIFFT